MIVFERLDTNPVCTYTVFVNLTLSVDKKVVERARKAAGALGKSLNQIIREFLEDLGGGTSAAEDIREMQRLSKTSRGRSRGWAFDRDEIHERS
jgi:hypothetical protein